MSRWFRFYDDAINDPKVQRLSAEMFRAWVNMLCLASKYGGSIPKADIAFALRASEKGASAIMDYLIERGLLEDRGEFVAPHNWDGRQYKSDDSKDRVKRYRERKRNADCNVTETVTSNDSNEKSNALEQSRADTEQKIDSAVEIFDEMAKVCRVPIDSPSLWGFTHGIDALLHRGFSRETILSGAANAMRDKAKPPNWNYFAKCIESENEQRSQPAKPEVQRGKSETLSDVANRMSSQVIDFGPKPGGIRGQEDGGSVRLLPQGGRE